MKHQIAVEINCDDEECDDCDFLSKEFCQMFNEPCLDNLRCDECIAAEFKFLRVNCTPKGSTC